ncbi:alpha/beta hydrolase [Amycolatopsis minnesotensis]|uniref:Alpha/beta hydrolase n=1 Tax=Amycolatopsis minnesotensis TaxID=337894 RepID=A0ABN2QR58_9PSEU
MTTGSAGPLIISLRDGRKVQYEVYGDPAGSPVLWFHGGGSSRLEGAILHVPANHHGLRLIALDRPGVGGSDPHPNRSVRGYATDIAEILDELSIERASVGGLSNGGMYAMAVASQLPDRVHRVVPVNPAIPVADTAARAALSRKTRMIYGVLERNPQRFVRAVEQPSSRGWLIATLSRFGNPDAHLFADPERAAMLAALRSEAARQPHSGGLAQELALGVGDWGFDHRAVTTPVFLLCGEKDSGLGYAKVWAGELPQGHLSLVPGGHMGIFAPAVARRVTELLRGSW